uniref:Uncharacterized protein n=1 Tax=viral metagenome TaxID=1070528 RepID=A0A6C0IE55_9ZZZZ
MSTLEFVHIPKTGGVSIVFTYFEYQWGYLADRDKVRERIPHYDLRPRGPPCSFWHHHELIETLYTKDLTRFVSFEIPWTASCPNTVSKISPTMFHLSTPHWPSGK